jgi:hypothetical protein
MVLTAVDTQSTVSLNVMSCTLVEVHRRIAGTYYLHLQVRKVGQARSKEEEKSKLSAWLTVQS